MRKILPRGLAAAATLTAVLVPTAGANFNGGMAETVFVEPTAATTYMPSSSTYFAPRSYNSFLPTAYTTTSNTLVPTSSVLVPSAYTTTSYIPTASTYYVPTYYSGRLFGGRRLARRPVYETSLSTYYDPTPTSYYLPTTTTMEMPFVATSAMVYGSGCQESTVAFNPPAPVGVGSAVTTSKPIVSQPLSAEPPYKGPVPQTPPSKPPAKPTARPAEQVPPAPAPPVEELPKAELKEMEPELPVSPPAGPTPAEKPKDPLEPGPGNLEEPKDRQAFRPAATEMKPKMVNSAQNLLRGEVYSISSNKPSPALTVVFSDLSHRYKDRSKTTDLKGGFEIYLPSGDWMIEIIDPDAKAGARADIYGPVTATDGKYLDDTDRPIYNLKLNH